MAAQRHISPSAFVTAEEGTLNPETGLFACTICYMAMGTPTAGPLGRWHAGDPIIRCNDITKPQLYIHVARTIAEARECRSQGFCLITMIRAEYGSEPAQSPYITYRYRYGARADDPRFVVLACSNENNVWINENDTLVIGLSSAVIPKTATTALRVGWLAGYLREEQLGRARDLSLEGRPGQILRDWRASRVCHGINDTWHIAVNDWVALLTAE